MPLDNSGLKEDILEIKEILKELQAEAKTNAIRCAKCSTKIEYVEEKQKGMMSFVQGIIMMLITAVISYFGGKR